MEVKDIINRENREVFIYEDIGPAWAGMVSASLVHSALSELGQGDVSFRVNSYGGSVDEALAMVEIASRHNGEVTVSVDSVAASAATVFPVVFDSTIAEHGRMMIHEPWGVVMGNAADMRQLADVLDVYRDSIVSVYAQSMTIDDDSIRAAMEAETWYSADEAQAAGLVNEVTETAGVQAKLCAANRFKNTPADLLDSGKVHVEPEEKPTPERIAAKLRAMRVAARIRRNMARA